MPVAVLARNRAAVLHDEIRRLLEEMTVLVDSFAGFQVESDALVDAAFAEMSVVPGLVTVFVEQLAVVAQIGAEHARMHRRILPAFVRDRGLTGNDGRAAVAGLAHFPNSAHFAGVAYDLNLRRIRFLS